MLLEKVRFGFTAYQPLQVILWQIFLYRHIKNMISKYIL